MVSAAPFVFPVYDTGVDTSKFMFPSGFAPTGFGPAVTRQAGEAVANFNLLMAAGHPLQAYAILFTYQPVGLAGKTAMDQAQFKGKPMSTSDAVKHQALIQFFGNGGGGLPQAEWVALCKQVGVKNLT